jgi:hypothetical protein
MIDRKITLPDMILFAGTRVALGVGIGMLMSKNLSNDARKATGWRSPRLPLSPLFRW